MLKWSTCNKFYKFKNIYEILKNIYLAQKQGFNTYTLIEIDNLKIYYVMNILFVFNI